MALNKKNEFETETVQLSEFAKALSHPARMAILEELATQQSCICGEIVNVLPLSQSTVSQHLRELQKAGLINGTIDGAKSCYCINWENFSVAVSELKNFTDEILKKRPKQNSTCC